MPDNTLKYTRAEKLKIVKEHVDDGLSYDKLSKNYGINELNIVDPYLVFRNILSKMIPTSIRFY